MPRITRSSDLLNLIDGLFYIYDEVIDLASAFYNKLKSIVATFGEEASVKLVPHVTSLLSKLNDSWKVNCELKQEMKLLSENLIAAENKCLDLNNSFKDKTVACLEIEDDYESKIHCITEQLNKVREQNVCLKDLVDKTRNNDSDRLVLEADVKSLRAYLTAAANYPYCLRRLHASGHE
ncbi:hypothetical protein J6590_072278 [Homalodisca vitripennis]|nr:hypothetical protein J6590_072278 [Homalodisca vitripennis]